VQPFAWPEVPAYQPVSLPDLVAGDPVELAEAPAGAWLPADDVDPAMALRFVTCLDGDDFNAVLDEADRRSAALGLAYTGRDTDRQFCDGLLQAAALDVEAAHLAAKQARLAGLPWFGAGAGVGGGLVLAIVLAVVFGAR
jgi:hypothetical protein